MKVFIFLVNFFLVLNKMSAIDRKLKISNMKFCCSIKTNKSFVNE